jgi:CCR4-NOT transcription complex subunit 2
MEGLGILGQSGFSAMASEQNTEFAMESEDFPALGGGMGGGSKKPGAPGGDSGDSTSGVSPIVASAFSGAAGMLGKDVAKAAKSGDGKIVEPSSDADRFGLLGLLSVIRMTDPDLNILALGTDLTTLGLNLNSSECLYATFASPWADGPSTTEPQYTLPLCYYMQPPALKTSHLSKFQLETLFYIFYAMPKDILQAYSAQEL